MTLIKNEVRINYMSIITYNNNSGIDFSSVSLSEASYMINSYIEESLTDM